MGEQLHGRQVRRSGDAVAAAWGKHRQPDLVHHAEVGVEHLRQDDDSARIQSVTAECGVLYDVLRQFHQLSGVPVLLNTSFNGPRQPIIERPEQAIAFLLETGLDALYFDNLRVERA